MLRRIHALALALTLALGAAPATAQRPEAKEEGDLLLRIDAPVTIAPAESASTVWVISDDATIEGVVRQSLIVMGGTARIRGTVRGDVSVFSGRLELGPTARVDGGAFLYRSTLARDPKAVVRGGVETSRGPAFGQWLAFGFWLSLTVVVLFAGVLFAAVAGEALRTHARTLVEERGASVVTAIVVWTMAPVVASASFATLVGIPLGLAILLLVLPLLGFVGYIVAGRALGGVLLERALKLSPDAHPYRAVLTGLMAFQLLGFLPVLGVLLVLLAGAVGAGALVYRVWSEWRSHRSRKLVLAPA